MNFKNPYNPDDLSAFLGGFLPDFSKDKRKISLTQVNKNVCEAHLIGRSEDLDLNIFEIQYSGSTEKRVGLTQEAFRIMRDSASHRALAVFYSEETSNWRFSLLTMTPSIKEAGKVKVEYSNPRRYSFYLGPEAKVHTPEQFLVAGGEIKDFEDLQNRFSIEVVNKEFYKHVAKYFNKLVGGEVKTDHKTQAYKRELQLPSVSEDDKKTYQEFAVRLIGRIIFCWFLKQKKSDSGVPLVQENLLSLKAASNNSNYYHTTLEKLFFEILNTPQNERRNDLPEGAENVPFLNGGLFDPHDSDYYKGQPAYNLKISDDWFKDFFEVLETYNFTIDENTSVDVDLSVDPEMLGRIFENLLAEINPATGESARKATGSYYTPRAIVEYMVDESLKQHLVTETQIGEEKISHLISYSEDGAKLNEKEKESIIDALDKIKVIDPACGSGAFPMGVLQKMLLVLQKVDPESQQWIKRQLERIEDQMVRKELEKKLRNENWDYVHKLGIIKNSVYGVDLQPIAVEISKLRFFLSLVVDEKIEDNKPNRGIEPLPNLEFKFVATDSLVGLPKLKSKQTTLMMDLGDTSDIKIEEKISNLQKLRDSFFVSYSKEKKQIEKKFKEIQNEMFDYLKQNFKKAEEGSDSITFKLATWNPFSDESSDWFDSSWMLGVKDGFNIVIANPPYITYKGKQKVNIEKNLIEKYIKIYLHSAEYKINSFALFLELGTKLLSKNGILSYIIPSTFLQNEYLKKIRKYLLSNYHINYIISFSNKVFKATTDSIILFVRNEFTKDLKTIVIKKDSLVFDGTEKEKYYSQSAWNQTEDAVINLKTTSEDDLVIKKIEKNSQILGKYLEVYVGIVARGIKKFLLDRKLNNKYKKYLQGKHLSRFKICPAKLFVNFDVDKLHSNTDESVYLQPEKILIRKTGNVLLGTYDDEQHYTDQSVYNLYPKPENNLDLKYVLALLNSSLMNFYFNKKMITNPDVFPYIKGVHLKKLSLKDIKPVEQEAFIEIVDKILAAKKKDPKADTSKLEEKIDQMVYKLYGLTKPERDIVENSIKK